MSSKGNNNLLKFQKTISARFKRIDLLNLALTHRSYTNEGGQSVGDNERLEFLGDAVLGLVISERLYRGFPHLPEGEYARMKSYIVSEDTLARIASSLDIPNYLILGKGERLSGGTHKKAIMADCMEAIIGAVFLDGGFKKARTFILKHWEPEIAVVIADKHDKDYKSLLQNYTLKSCQALPVYKVIGKSGPDHQQVFAVEVRINGKIEGSGEGSSKKGAEKSAAKMAYLSLVGDD